MIILFLEWYWFRINGWNNSGWYGKLIIISVMISEFLGVIVLLGILGEL